MRFASYLTTDGTPTWGVLHGTDLLDLGPTGADIAPSLREAIASQLLPTELPSPDSVPAVPADSVELLPVIPDPAKVLCIGVNYKTHQDETGRPDTAKPPVFTRFADSLAGANVELPIPDETTMYDYEGELALVIGEAADHVAAADAWDVIAGYAPFNDLSARDWQRHSGQWTAGKNFPQSGSFGPYFIPSSYIDDVESLVLETRVNGEVRQRAELRDLIFNIPELIEYVTAFTPLAPGDVIVTGTPGGVGLFMEPQEFLESGDLVEVEVAGVGVLQNRLV